MATWAATPLILRVKAPQNQIPGERAVAPPDVRLGRPVCVVLTVAFRLAQVPAGTDETAPAHYVADPDGTPQIAVPVATMLTETT
jgi:hypothetical protein